MTPKPQDVDDGYARATDGKRVLGGCLEAGPAPTTSPTC
jgi:hypothetical protein